MGRVKALFIMISYRTISNLNYAMNKEKIIIVKKEDWPDFSRELNSEFLLLRKEAENDVFLAETSKSRLLSRGMWNEKDEIELNMLKYKKFLID